MQHAIALAWKTITSMVDSFFLNLPNLCIGMVVFWVFFASSRISKDLTVKLLRRALLDNTLSVALGNIASLVHSLIGLLIAAVIVIPGFSLANLVAGLGITSVAVGFAFQDVLRNFFAGILLLWQKPFAIGDEIKTGNYEGTVQDINIRSTTLQMHTGEIVLVPNGMIFTDPVVVYTASGKRQVEIAVKVPANVSFEEARSRINQVLALVNEVGKEPAPHIYLSNVEPESINLTVSFWTLPNKKAMLDVTDRVASAIRTELSKPVQELPRKKAG